MTYTTNIYLFKVNNRNIRKKCMLYQKVIQGTYQSISGNAPVLYTLENGNIGQK